MTYTVIGLSEKGDLAIYNRGYQTPPTEAMLEQACRNLNYTQVMVTEDKFAGYCKRYVYDLTPTLREVPV